MPCIISMLYNLEEKGKKCAIKANNFSNPGTMLMLVVFHLSSIARVNDEKYSTWYR
jgi:hypothetical protein